MALESDRGADAKPRVLLTDHPWPDVDVETAIFAAAGIDLVAGPVEAPRAQEVERLATAHEPDAIMTCWASVSARAIAAPPALKIVARMGVGLDNLDVVAAPGRGAWVTNVPDYCVEEVSDHAVALLLAHCRDVVGLDRLAKRGVWKPEAARPRRVRDLTIGLIGFGRMGRAAAAKLRGFGCKVIAFSRRGANGEGVESVTMAELQARADAIILHLPLTPETAHLVDDAFIQTCARAPLLINVSRGGLVDNDALLRGLDSGKLCGAALDVIKGEPNPPESVLRHEDILVTPHIAFLSPASLIELRRRACEEVVRVLSGGRPVFPCNEPAVRAAR
jgi:phosphoglycerate dehydrogenase-like enzyme